MDYQRIYDELIASNKSRRGYVERHHIIPKSLGGSDDSSNIKILTAREHYVAHLLLARIHGGKMIHALHMMQSQPTETSNRPQRKGSVLYEWARQEHAKLSSKIGKQRVGEANGSFDTRWICNVNLKENKKISKNDPIPEGWIKGRNRWKPKKKKPRKYPGKTPSEIWEIRRYQNNKNFKDLKDEYSKSNLSLNAFITKKIDEGVKYSRRTLYNHLGYGLG